MLCEQEERRTELLSFAMPRFAEVVWGLAEKRGYVRAVPYGAPVLFALALVLTRSCRRAHGSQASLLTCGCAYGGDGHAMQGVVMHAYRREPRNLKPIYRTVIKHAFAL
jgi:hypothetical protein